MWPLRQVTGPPPLSSLGEQFMFAQTSLDTLPFPLPRPQGAESDSCPVLGVWGN